MLTMLLQHNAIHKKIQTGLNDYMHTLHGHSCFKMLELYVYYRVGAEILIEFLIFQINIKMQYLHIKSTINS